LEKSHLYFTKQPFDPETVYELSNTDEHFFAEFYGKPSDVQRFPPVDLPGLLESIRNFIEINYLDIHPCGPMDAEKRASMLRSLHARASINSP
jgi:hypothetical protein